MLTVDICVHEQYSTRSILHGWLCVINGEGKTQRKMEKNINFIFKAKQGIRKK
jgi:hypothetical protein